MVQRPDLVVDHASAYAALIQQEASAAGRALVGRTVAWLLAVMCACIFLTLTGTALMFGFLQNQFHWILAVVPGFALVLTAVAVIKAKKPLPTDNFPELKAQLGSDAQALRMAA